MWLKTQHALRAVITLTQKYKNVLRTTTQAYGKCGNDPMPKPLNQSSPNFVYLATCNMLP